MYLPLKIIKVVPKMSFPPGPPIHLPGMPPVPPMLPPPYAVPPMGGMIPMTVGMMPAPMMAPVAMTMPAPIIPPHHKLSLKKVNTNNQNSTFIKKDNNTVSCRSYLNAADHPEALRGPPVTVFVGNITERAQDSLVRQILQRCGIVLNWKRVQGANGKLQAFGFCEYGDPESALRAIRLLHDWEIGGKKLVVKVDAKTKEKLDEYKAKMAAKHDTENKDGKEDDKEKEKDSAKEGEDKEEGETSDEPLDEMSKQRDEIIRAAIEGLLRAHEAELSRPIETKESTPPTTTQSSQEKSTPKINRNQDNSPKPKIDFEKLKKTELDEMDLEEDKKSLIHREIDKFRDTYKRAEEEKEKDRDRRSSRRREYESPDTRSRDHDRDREKRYHRERSQGREDSIGSSSSHRRRRSSRERTVRSPRSSPLVTRERSRERVVERARSDSQDKEWSREKSHSSESRSKDKEWDKEEEEEAYERKKLERKLREKEAIYQERLRNWEARERRKAKDYEKERLKTEEQKREELKEARRLKEFLEDYDDERDDPKYFKGSALLRRMKEREKEIEEDLLDRQREKEELDELRKKLAEEGHPDPEAEVERFLQEESRLAEPLSKEQTPDSDHEMVVEKQLPPAKLKPLTQAPVSPVQEPQETSKQHKAPAEDESTQNSFSGFSDFIANEESKPLGFTSLRLGASPTQPAVNSPAISHSSGTSGSKRKMTVEEVFNANDDEPEQKKKRKLIPLDDAQEEVTKTSSAVSQMTLDEKRKHIKDLIEKIPTEKNELFAYNLDWSVVDKVLMEKRIRPWINKKIIEYIGEEEPTLVEFICSKVMAGSAAQSILDDVSMVLDEEAEVFVVKMWRLLIYEIEAKKLGLVCKTQESSQSKS